MMDLRTFTRPGQFTVFFREAADAWAHGAGSDIEGSLPVLYALVRMLKPALILELGTRHGVSTRTLAAASVHSGSRVITVDPDSACLPHVQGLPNTELYVMLGEELWASPSRPSPDFLFIDTDPHTYEQTMMWMQTWVAAMKPGSLVAFHDIYPARPEIRVADAVRDYLIAEQPGWIWRELATDEYGLGLLWI